MAGNFDLFINDFKTSYAKTFDPKILEIDYHHKWQNGLMRKSQTQREHSLLLKTLFNNSF